MVILVNVEDDVMPHLLADKPAKDAIGKYLAEILARHARRRKPMTAVQLAELVHETYERLAPSFGFEARPDTRIFDPDTPNGRLMVAVCANIQKLLGEQDD